MPEWDGVRANHDTAPIGPIPGRQRSRAPSSVDRSFEGEKLTAVSANSWWRVRRRRPAGVAQNVRLFGPVGIAPMCRSVPPARRTGAPSTGMLGARFGAPFGQRTVGLAHPQSARTETADDGQPRLYVCCPK